MNSHPLVCICIPTYNAECTIRDTLLSILTQTYKNLVVHISDNASTDATLDIIESISDSRVHIHRHTNNVGGEANFNRCINLAEGSYTAIYHADDLYDCRMVERQVDFLESHIQAGAVFTEAELIDENGNKIGKINFPMHLGSYDYLYDFQDVFKAVLRSSNFLICPSAMVRTNVYKHDVKCWRGELFKSSADLDVWFRIAQIYPIGLLPNKLMQYRVSSSQFSSQVRMNTERADFFLVVDHYLEQNNVRQMLNLNDMENYRLLERRDRVMRVVNSFIYDEADKVKHLLYDAFSLSSLRAGFKSKRGLGLLIASIYLKLLLLLRLKQFGKLTLEYLKFLMRK